MNQKAISYNEKNQSKTYRLIVFCVICSCLMVIGSCASSTPQSGGSDEMGEEVLKKRSRSTPLPSSGCCPINRTYAGIVVLDKICFSPQNTQLVLHLIERKRVCVIQDQNEFLDDQGKSYQLLRITGVDYCPKRRSMVNTPFSLYFEALDPQTSSFSYRENASSPHANNPWEFIDVDLLECGMK